MITGDGDALSIGGNHLIHALRRNINIKILLFNNRIYGLTKGQYSPTSEQGKVTKSSPVGSLDTPFNPLSLALGAEASFVARTIDSDRKHLQGVLRAAADHRGRGVRRDLPELPDLQRRRVRSRSPRPASRDENVIRLEHGEPIRFGADKSLGLGVQQPRVAACGRRDRRRRGLDAGPRCARGRPFVRVRAVPAGQLRRGAERRSGVLRQAPRPSYDDLMSEQIETARARQGDGDLAALLAGGDTWQVG